ncbi:terpene synthase family protein [Streptomyces telluris]|uniref:Terpene synthase n=1 Tax=Streptomyces telluris TaxID=2720021 RepID=A0A9X2LN98_9ACTN|nr:pentalenene synthase [Streptomyces telluris]MCQ8774383.1 pentalenene synthase [Streptomyces telluris]
MAQEEALSKVSAAQGPSLTELFDSRGGALTERGGWDARMHLQAVEFGCPWPVRAVNPHLGEVREGAVAWMESFGLVGDRLLNADRYARWLLAESAAWWHPEAPAERLQLAADYVGWVFTPFDDVFDGPVGRDLAATGTICQALTAVLDAPDASVPANAPPRVRAFADLWRRSRQGRTPEWVGRATVHWREYFAAQVAEVGNRVHGRVSTLRQLVVIKCAYPIFDMAEVVGDFEVPPVVWHAPLFAEIRDCMAEIITATNDLVSADKEAQAGDGSNNLLLIAERRDGLTRPQAFERLRRMVHERFERVLALEEQAGDWDVLLTEAQRHEVRRYLDCLHDIVAGDNRWERVSGRYH